MAISEEKVLKLQDVNYIRNELGISMRWRILTSKGGKARIVAYQDARDVQNVLDDICGPTNWQNEPRNINGKVYMSISINIDGEGWVYKADVGIESDIEGVKGESSDAFKRAAIMWGIFRDVYSTEYIVLDVNGKDPVTPDGEILKTPEAISVYCNNISTPMHNLKKLYNSIKHAAQKNEEVMSALKTITVFCKEL